MEMIIEAVKGRTRRSRQVRVFFDRPPFEVSTQEPVVQAVGEAVREILGREVEYAGSHPWLDSAILAGAGISTVIIGPDGYGAHGAVEYVDFPSVVDTAKVLFSAISKIAG